MGSLSRRAIIMALTGVALLAALALGQQPPPNDQATSYDNVFTERFQLIQTEYDIEVTTDADGRIIEPGPFERAEPVNDASGEVVLLWGDRDLAAGTTLVTHRATFPIVDGRAEMRIHEAPHASEVLMRADFFDLVEGQGGELVRKTTASPVLLHFGMGPLRRQDAMDLHFIQPDGTPPFKVSYLLEDVLLGESIDTSQNALPAGLLAPRMRAAAFSTSFTVFVPETTPVNVLRFGFTERTTAKTYTDATAIVDIDGIPTAGIYGIGGVYFESDQPLEQIQLQIDDLVPVLPYNEESPAPQYWALYENDTHLLAAGQMNWNHVLGRAPTQAELDDLGVDGYTLTPVIPLPSDRENRAFRLIVFRAGIGGFLGQLGECLEEKDDNWLNSCECFSEHECFTMHEVILNNCGSGTTQVVGMATREDGHSVEFEIVTIFDARSIEGFFGKGPIGANFKASRSETTVTGSLHEATKSEATISLVIVEAGHALTRQSAWTKCVYECFDCRGARYTIEVPGEGCWRKCKDFREGGAVRARAIEGPVVPDPFGTPVTSGGVDCSEISGPNVPKGPGGDPLVPMDCEE